MTYSNPMKKIGLYLKFLKRISIRSLYFNLKYLPFKQAIHLPILISRKVYLRRMSGKIKLDCPISSGLVRLGFGDIGIFDDKVSRTIWDVSGTVVFKGRTEIGHGSKIAVGSNGVLILGENFSISAETSIVAYSRVQFGKDCLLSWDVLIMDTDLHSIRNDKGEVVNPTKPIIIGDNVWIGSRSMILKGVQIPNNCVIGANSMVNKTLDIGNGVYAGNPVKLIKENITWEF